MNKQEPAVLSHDMVTKVTGKIKWCQSTAVPLYNNASNSILKEIRGYSFERGYVERLEKWSLLHDFTGAAKITILIFLKGY